MSTYHIEKANAAPPLKGEWDSAFWEEADIININHFRKESSDHRPLTEVKALYSDTGLHIIFRVQDRYVRAVAQKNNDFVHPDSCVEFFVKPKGASGYFNFETNCGGTILASYIEDHRRTENGFAKFSRLKLEELDMIGIYHSMPKIVDPEITEPTEWINELFIPFDLLKIYTREFTAQPGEEWTANLYKCAEDISHPHWAAWAPVSKLNFHDPESFGVLRFG